jgi:hypothetical protein
MSAGVFMILAGILAIGLPLVAGVAVNVLVAWLLVFCGAAHFVLAWHLRGAGGIIWDVVGRSRQAMKEYQAGILAEYVPYTPLTAQNLKKLADLEPKTLAIMHGSSFTGDCAQALEDLNVMLREVFGPRK